MKRSKGGEVDDGPVWMHKGLINVEQTLDNVGRKAILEMKLVGWREVRAVSSGRARAYVVIEPMCTGR